MFNYKVEICGLNTADIPILSAHEKNVLLQKILAGDKLAREKFIYCNLRLVLSVIQRFTNRRETLDDIFQIGCVGLIKAIDNFDINLGVQFSTYAVPMIIGEIRRHLRDNNSIRVSRSLKDIAYKALQAKEILTKKDLKEPTINEIAKECKLPKDEIIHAIEAIQEPLSLFEPIYKDGGDTIFVMDQLSDIKNSDENWLDNLSLNEGIKKLDLREKLILHLRFFEGKTQTEVAEEIGISQAQISRLEKNALLNIKKNIS